MKSKSLIIALIFAGAFSATSFAQQFDPQDPQKRKDQSNPAIESTPEQRQQDQQRQRENKTNDNRQNDRRQQDTRQRRDSTDIGERDGLNSPNRPNPTIPNPNMAPETDQDSIVFPNSERTDPNNIKSNRKSK